MEELPLASLGPIHTFPSFHRRPQHRSLFIRREPQPRFRPREQNAFSLTNASVATVARGRSCRVMQEGRRRGRCPCCAGGRAGGEVWEGATRVRKFHLRRGTLPRAERADDSRSRMIKFADVPNTWHQVGVWFETVLTLLETAVSPVLGTNYWKFDWFLPKTGLTAVLKGLIVAFGLSIFEANP